MKLKQLLFISVLLFSTQGFADMFNHDFWSPNTGQAFDTLTPKKGQGFISTDVSFARQKYKSDAGTQYKKTLTEYMGYGITDRLTGYAELGREWDKFTNQSTSTGKLDHWFLASGYRFIDNGTDFLNGFIAYGQKHNSFTNEYLKGYSVYGAYGHYFETFSPHTFIGWNQSINIGRKNDEEFYWYGGSSIPLPLKFSAELGLEYDRQASSFKTWSSSTSLNYTFSDHLISELYWQYVLDNSYTHKLGNIAVDHGYTLGFRIATDF